MILERNQQNYFFNVEKTKLCKYKTISILNDTEGNSHTGIKSILTVQKKNYKNLYSKSNATTDIKLFDLQVKMHINLVMNRQ